MLEGEPLAERDARELVRRIVAGGSIVFSRHARDEMGKDGLTDRDVLHVVRAGLMRPAEMERGTWRYRFEAGRTAAVIAFQSEMELRIVTAWRSKP
jgi:hypothetical protein